RSQLTATVGFAAALIPAVIWMHAHPETLQATLARYHLSQAQPGASTGLTSLLHYYTLEERLSLYWRYFDPVYLFLAGSPDPTLSTARAGVLLVAVAAFLPVGIYD